MRSRTLARRHASRSDNLETCFDCGRFETYRRVQRWAGWVYFCKNCDLAHEGQSWFTRLGQRLHLGLVTVGIYRSLRKRLQIMLVKQTRHGAYWGQDLDKLARAAGRDTASVITRLAQFEARR